MGAPASTTRPPPSTYVQSEIRSAALARRNLTYVKNRFRFGYALLTELNEARQNLVVADNQRVDASIDAALAAAALARATGTLEPPPSPGHPRS